jgi:hypothetical protein
VIEGTAQDGYFMHKKLEDALKRKKERRSKPIVEEPNAPNKRGPATSAHNVSKKVNDAVLELDVLKVKLLNSIEQLSITVIKN